MRVNNDNHYQFQTPFYQVTHDVTGKQAIPKMTQGNILISEHPQIAQCQHLPNFQPTPAWYLATSLPNTEHTSLISNPCPPPHRVTPNVASKWITLDATQVRPKPHIEFKVSKKRPHGKKFISPLTTSSPFLDHLQKSRPCPTSGF